MDMGSATLVSVAEYLTTAYSPDRDYIDGEVVERNLGEYDHGGLQMALAAYLYNRRSQWGIRVVPEQRVQVRSERFRIPDVCAVLAANPVEQIFTRPPFLCVEILSKDDRMSQMQERISDYLQMGVAYVWLVDPSSRRAWIYTTDAIGEVKDGVLRTQQPDIEVPLAEIFAEL
ncbi:MAG: Uma2 family endonuclease [Acidobacteria bacterium]|nr:Uma2 family endonuclease [Acidobacteriota bacterium]